MDAIAGVKSLLPVLHPRCASLDLKAIPMICTGQLAHHAVDRLEDEVEEEETEEDTESELSAQLKEARDKISVLENRLKDQEKLLREAEQKRVMGIESAETEHTRSSVKGNIGSESQNSGLKRPATAAAAEDRATCQSLKKVRGSDEQDMSASSVKTKHTKFSAATAQPSGLPESTNEPSSTTSVPPNIIKPSASTPKGSLENAASPKSTATALPSVSSGAEGAAGVGQQLTVEEMLADFKDKLSDNLLRMGNPSYVNAALQDSDSD